MGLILLHEWLPSGVVMSTPPAKLIRSSIVVATLASFLQARHELVSGTFAGPPVSGTTTDPPLPVKPDTNDGGVLGSAVVGETHFGFLDNHVPFISDAISRRLTLFHSYVVYAKLLILPTDLSCDYTYVGWFFLGGA